MADRLDVDQIEEVVHWIKGEVAEMMVAFHDAYAKTWEEWATEFRELGMDDPAEEIVSEEELNQEMPGGWHETDPQLPEGWRVIEGGAPPKPRKGRRGRGRAKTD